KGDRHDKRDTKGDQKADGGRMSARDDDDDDDDDDDRPRGDGGKAVAGRRTPAQLAFRKGVWERREKDIEIKVHKDGKRITDEEREAIRAHWLRLARLMRIRELAQQEKEEAIVKRADAALAREEKSLDAKLEKLVVKAQGGAK